VKKISVYGNSSRIVTDFGNFTIGSIEPADNPPGGWLDHLRSKRLKFHKELVEEIQSRAPQSNVSVSWLVRHRWNRLPSAKTAKEGPHRNGAGDILKESETEQLNKAWTVIHLVWAFLVGSLGISLLACTFMANQLEPLSSSLPIETLRVIFFGIAMVTVVAASSFRKTLLKISESSLYVTARRHQQPPAAAKYLNATVVAMALLESIGIYGVVFFVLSKDVLALYLFILISATAMYYYRPRKEELMQLAVELQKSQSAESQVQ
jgi:hypothetical protein